MLPSEHHLCRGMPATSTDNPLPVPVITCIGHSVKQREPSGRTYTASPSDKSYARIAVRLTCQCNLSTITFPWGRCAHLYRISTPNFLHTFVNICDLNVKALSTSNSTGGPRSKNISSMTFSANSLDSFDNCFQTER
ncbi:hypothetical protein GJ496_005712 [Pomphorhynchus laevis]|nr:hypothetical protein GJ496_005712 [Pomphorhynchus laevis]